jgi:hypothetical protein
MATSGLTHYNIGGKKEKPPHTAVTLKSDQVL